MLSISFYDGVKYHRQDFISRDNDFFGNGVVNLSHFPFTLDANPDMNISIGAGVAWVDGYRIQNDSNNIVLTVPAADSSNPRIDIVQIGHDDIHSQAVLSIKTGVPGSSPVEPSADPNYLKLFAINVPANSTSISASNITDRRQLVPLNVSGTQINLAGAAGTGQTNNFTQTQQFTAPSASIEANQIILGQTDYVASPNSPVFLASAAANGVGLDKYGNILPIAPSSIQSGNTWSILDKNGNKILSGYLDGTKKLSSANNVLDDGAGNMVVGGNFSANGKVTIGKDASGNSVFFPNASAIYMDQYGNMKTPSGAATSSTWSLIDSAGNTLIGAHLVPGNGSTVINSQSNSVDILNGGAYVTQFWKDANNIYSKWGGTYGLFKFQIPNNRFEFRDGADANFINAAALSFVNASKREWKKNIEPFEENALSLVNNTPIRTYHFKSELDDVKKHVGMITDEAPKEVLDQTETGVDAYAIGAIAWKAIQELTAKVQELESKLAELEGEQ